MKSQPKCNCAVRRLLLGGTLDRVVKRGKTLPEGRLRTVALWVLLGLVNMQTHARLHHVDLKPANLGLLRAGDYGSTRHPSGRHCRSVQSGPHIPMLGLGLHLPPAAIST